MASSSSSYPPLVTAVSSADEGLVAVAHPQQNVPGLSSSASSSTSSWRVGLYNVQGGGGGYLQTTLTATTSNSTANDKQRSIISGKIQRLLFLGGEASSSSNSSSSSHYLAAVSSQCVGVWDLRRGVVSHTIVPAKKSSASPSSHYKIVDAQVAATSHYQSSRHPHNASRTSSDESDKVNARSLYLLVQHGTDATAGGGDGNEDDDMDVDGDERKLKSVIWQYDGSQLIRKIKAKDGNSGRMLVTPGAEFLYVSSRRKVRVHSGQTGKVVAKHSFPSPVVAMAAAPSSSHGGSAAYVLLESGAIHLAHPGTNDDGSKTTPVVAMTSTSLLPTSLSLSSWPLLEGCPASGGDNSTGEGLLVGGRSLIRLSGDDEPVASSPKLLLDLATVDSGVVRCAVGAADNKSSDRGATTTSGLLVAVLYKGGSIQVQRRDPFQSGKAFAWLDDEAGNSAAADSAADRSKKRSKDGPAVLGPAHAGGTALHVHEPGIAVSEGTKTAMGDGDGENDVDGDDEDNDGDVDDDNDGEESSPPRKRSRSEDQPNDETIATRLAQLRAQLIADEEEEARQDALAVSGGAMSATAAGGEVVTFQPKKATTESLSQLLKQALQDDALLEMCLAVSNPSIIRESVADLSPSNVSALVAAVTSRVAFRPARAEALCLWLTVLLQTRKASLEVLQPLQNLINDRVELLPALLKLEGRLSLLSP